MCFWFQRVPFEVTWLKDVWKEQRNQVQPCWSEAQGSRATVWRGTSETVCRSFAFFSVTKEFVSRPAQTLQGPFGFGSSWKMRASSSSVTFSAKSGFRAGRKNSGCQSFRNLRRPIWIAWASGFWILPNLMGAIWISHVLKQIGFQTFPERYGAHLDFAPLVRHVLLVPASPFRNYLVFAPLESTAFRISFKTCGDHSEFWTFWKQCFLGLWKIWERPSRPSRHIIIRER